MKKKIGIDIRLTSSQRGISSYIINLLINYKENLSESNIDFYLFSDRKPVEEILNLNYKLIILPIKIYPIWDIIIPFILLFHRIELFHCPGNSSPFYKLGKLKYVVTIHDLIFYKTNFSGNFYQKFGRFYLKFNVWFNISRINKIIAVSNSTKYDIINSFNINENKIQVIYESCHSNFFLDNKQSLHNLFSFICFGSDDPRKNTELVLKTFDAFFSKNKNFYLNVVGLPEDHMRFLKNNLEIKNEKNFRFHSHISRDKLFLLYEESIALVYPSLYEGFGVPLIESFKMCTPVITSNVSSLPEIAGNAAILIDPYSSNELLEAIYKIKEKETYDFYCLNSKNRATYFDWKIFSQETLTLYCDEI